MQSDLHGSAPDRARVALLLVDVINPFDFDGAEDLLVHARVMSERLAELCRRARATSVPIVYANDNFGRWRSEQRAIVERATEPGALGAEVVAPLVPARDDYFVIKPKHSAFYSTTLELLLRHLGVKRVILGGLQAHICVLFSANDAYMRDFELHVPQDCVASESRADCATALALMRDVLKASTRPSTELDLERLRRSGVHDASPTS